MFNALRIGVISREDYAKRTTAIARGEYKPREDEPKVWFESLGSLAQVLGDDNQELLRLIVERKPHSLTELERLSRRKKSNLSRTLRTLERYGVVELVTEAGRLVPKVKATDFQVEFGMTYSHPLV